MITTRRNFLSKAAGAAAAIPFAYAAVEKHLVKTLGMPEKAEFVTVDTTTMKVISSNQESTWNMRMYGVNQWYAEKQPRAYGGMK